MAAIRIAHLSDLHFVPETKDSAVWTAVRDYINNKVRPHAIFVTGDVTDSATHSEFAYARQCLDTLCTADGGDPLKYRIVAGNHDRFLYRGNSPPLGLGSLFPKNWPKDKHGRFDQTFSGAMQVTPDSHCDLTLQRPSPDHAAIPWKVRIIGLDSSAHHHWFAQGGVRPTDIGKACESAASAIDQDLVIVLVHHHVLPIPSVEQAKSKFGKLIDATGMLNAGSLLEALSRNQVDLVLHGHEHACYQATFAGADELATDVALLSAGSATGDKTLEGWDLTRVHFNVIELEDDRSVWLRQVVGSNNQLSCSDERKLLIPSSNVRLSRFIRRNRALGEASLKSPIRDLPTSRLRKHFEFKANRDIEITESRTDWQVSPTWTLSTTSSNGLPPDKALVNFRWADGGIDNCRATAQKAASAHDQYVFSFYAPNKNGARLARSVNTRWKWITAAAYTQAELDHLPDTSKTGPRQQHREFATIKCDDELRELILTVKLPTSFAPEPADVCVYYEKPDEPGKAHFGKELLPCLDTFGAGNIELRIPYPLPGYRYGVSWPVASAQLDMPSVKNRLCRLDGAMALMRSFMAYELNSWPATYRPKWDVYLFHQKEAQFRQHDMGDKAGAQIHVIRDARSAIRAAAWGDAIMIGKDDEGGRLEFTNGEVAVGYFPLMRRQEDFGFAPALLRLSFDSPLAACLPQTVLDACMTLSARLSQLVDVCDDGVINGIAAGPKESYAAPAVETMGDRP